jgi:hypothetical protein
MQSDPAEFAQRTTEEITPQCLIISVVADRATDWLRLHSQPVCEIAEVRRQQ